MPHIPPREKYITTALINGKEEEYDECSEDNKPAAKWEAEYLGKGVIYKVNNKVQEGSREYHFWRKKTSTMKLTKQTVVKQPSPIAGWIQLAGLLMFIFALINILIHWVTNWIFVPALTLYFYGMYLGARVTIVDEIENDQPEN